MFPVFGRTSLHAFRFLCAMAVSTSVVGFVDSSGSIQVRPPKHRASKPSLLSKENYRTMCEASPMKKEVESYERMTLPSRMKSNHAIFGLLLGDSMIESYEVFRRRNDSDSENVIVAYLKLGDHINGHPGVVHGGILSLIFDDALGFGYGALGIKMAVTANLNIDFRAPVLAGTYVRVAAQLEHREGRKLFWKAQMTSMDRKILFAEAN